MKLALSGVELEQGEDLSLLLDACRATGAEAVELWWPKNFDGGGVDGVIAQLSAAKIGVVSLSSGIELFRDEGSAAQQRHLLELIAIASSMGVSLVSTFFGFSSICDDERSIGGYIDLLAPCLDQAQAAGVTLLLENEFDAFGWDPAASDITRRPAVLRRLADRIGSPHFGLTFDPANYFCANVAPLAALETLLPHVRYVHVKDVVRTAGGPPDAGWREYRDFDRTYATCPLGQGQIPWPALLERLSEAGYLGPFCLEPHASTDRIGAWRQAADSLTRWTSQLGETSRCQ